MAGKAQVHEPLAVEAAGGVFQQGDAALVGGDQVVVGGKHNCNSPLRRPFWEPDWHSCQLLARQMFNRCACEERREAVLLTDIQECVIQKRAIQAGTWAYAMQRLLNHHALALAFPKRAAPWLAAFAHHYVAWFKAIALDLVRFEAHFSQIA